MIFHVDVNSAFLSWTAVKALREGARVDLRTVPAAVGGDEAKRHGVVLAKSQAARHYGIRTGESLFSARKKCPELVVVPPDFELYVKNSRAMMGIIRDFSPDVYPYSIDEAFLDMTGMEALMGPPMKSAAQLKDRIRGELGFTVNIGISSNFLLAKMASDFEKPDRIHTLFLEEIPEKLWPLPVSELFSVGRSARQKLYAMGIHTIGELAGAREDTLVKHFGSYGKMIREYANGVEAVPIALREAKEKSYGNSVTTARNLETLEEAEHLLLSLAETVGARIRLDGMRVSVVTVSLVDCSFRKWSHQRSLGHNTDITAELYEAGRTLLHEAWNGVPVRLLGLSAGKAVEPEEDFEQLTLFPDVRAEKQKKLDRAVDELRERFGPNSVVRASLMGTNKGGMSGAKLKKRLEEKKERGGETKGSAGKPGHLPEGGRTGKRSQERRDRR